MTTSDAPPPPGGPQRDDEPDGGLASDEEREATEGTQSADEAEVQRENAETSLDQPSQ